MSIYDTYDFGSGMSYDPLEYGYDLSSSPEFANFGLSDLSDTQFQDQSFDWGSIGQYLDPISQGYDLPEMGGDWWDTLSSAPQSIMDFVNKNSDTLGGLAKAGLGAYSMYDAIKGRKEAQKLAQDQLWLQREQLQDSRNVNKVSSADEMAGRRAIAQILSQRQGVNIDPSLAYAQQMREDVGFSPTGATPYENMPIGGPLQASDRSRSILEAIQKAQGQTPGFAEGGEVSVGMTGSAGVDPLILAQLASQNSFDWAYDPWAQYGRDIKSTGPAPWEWWKPGNQQYESMAAQGMQVPQVNMSMPTPMPNAFPQGAQVPGPAPAPQPTVVQPNSITAGPTPAGYVIPAPSAPQPYVKQNLPNTMGWNPKQWEGLSSQQQQRILNNQMAPPVANPNLNWANPTGVAPVQGPQTGGGIQTLASGGQYSGQGQHQGALGLLRGGSTGQADDVNANLSHGEYVFDADIVAALGDGNTEAGAAKLDTLRENIRSHKRSAPKSKIPPPAKDIAAYMKGR